MLSPELHPAMRQPAVSSRAQLTSSGPYESRSMPELRRLLATRQQLEAKLKAELAALQEPTDLELRIRHLESGEALMVDVLAERKEKPTAVKYLSEAVAHRHTGELARLVEQIRDQHHHIAHHLDWGSYASHHADSGSHGAVHIDCGGVQKQVVPPVVHSQPFRSITGLPASQVSPVMTSMPVVQSQSRLDTPSQDMSYHQTFPAAYSAPNTYHMTNNEFHHRQMNLY